jgi:argininosuccinate lyase
MRFDPAYVSTVHARNFEDAKALFVSPLIAIHYAHLVMLAERGILSAADAHALRAALDSLSVARLQGATFDGSCEDLFFHVEEQLASACGAERAGRLHTARSRNDIDMTMYRMRVREWLAATIDVSLDLRDALLFQARRHVDTVYAALTHTQPAQPTTAAHYLLAIVEQLERDGVRLRAAWTTVNRCPLGACAITGTGFDIDRQLTSDLLGFDAPTGNTYGSIAAADHLLEAVGAAGTLAIGLGRALQDLLAWCTAEVGYLRLADGFVQTSSIMPQKRNPVALEHARALASRAAAQAAAVGFVVHNTPFGDIVDIEDDLQPMAAAVFVDAQRATALTAAALRSAELDVERMAGSAERGGTTLTELADHLVREHGLAFRTAHRLVATLHERIHDAPGQSPAAAMTRASRDVLGASLEYSDDRLRELMSATHFVHVRRTDGGPSPVTVSGALTRARIALDGDRVWLDAARRGVTDAQARLDERSRAL